MVWARSRSTTRLGVVAVAVTLSVAIFVAKKIRDVVHEQGSKIDQGSNV